MLYTWGVYNDINKCCLNKKKNLKFFKKVVDIVYPKKEKLRDDAVVEHREYICSKGFYGGRV